MLELAYKQLSDPNQKKFIAIAGNIGSGKTTLTRKIAERLKWDAHFESVQDNPYLEDFYKDMNRWSFALQIYFLTHRFNTHSMIQQGHMSSIQDRSIYEDAHVFARALFEQGNMCPRDYENYLQLYHSLVGYLRAPSLMIFLKRSIPKLLERIRMRGRSFEQSFSVDYLNRLNLYYEEWFHTYDLGPALLVETDELDLLHNGQHFDELIQRISVALSNPNDSGRPMDLSQSCFTGVTGSEIFTFKQKKA